MNTTINNIKHNIQNYLDKTNPIHGMTAGAAVALVGIVLAVTITAKVAALVFVVFALIGAATSVYFAIKKFGAAPVVKGSMEKPTQSNQKPIEEQIVKLQEILNKIDHYSKLESKDEFNAENDKDLLTDLQQEQDRIINKIAELAKADIPDRLLDCQGWDKVPDPIRCKVLKLKNNE